MQITADTEIAPSFATPPTGHRVAAARRASGATGSRRTAKAPTEVGTKFKMLLDAIPCPNASATRHLSNDIDEQP